MSLLAGALNYGKYIKNGPSGRSGAGYRRGANLEWELLKEVNRSVNRHTAQVADAALYSVDEFWTRSGA